MTEPSPSPASGTVPSDSERTWGMLAHLSALFGLLVPVVGNTLAPWLVWLSKREESAFVASQAREAVNFNLTVSLAAIVCSLLMLVLVGFLLGTALFIAWLVLTLIAATKASEGEDYRYPFSLHFIHK
jgi:uncharacterized protein